LDELIAFKNRIISDKITNCLVKFRSNNEYLEVILVLVGANRSEKEYLMRELVESMKQKINKPRSHFGTNSSVYYKESGFISVKTWTRHFSDRSLNNLFNKSINLQRMSFDDLEITKNEIDIGPDKAIETTIKIKDK
jgi:S-adenosylmethionine:tRNA-ribosyltransferase-isomerase (queuine synthetase)